jgi:hypothetical protein
MAVVAVVDMVAEIAVVAVVDMVAEIAVVVVAVVVAVVAVIVVVAAEVAGKHLNPKFFLKFGIYSTFLFPFFPVH